MAILTERIFESHHGRRRMDGFEVRLRDESIGDGLTKSELTSNACRSLFEPPRMLRFLRCHTRQCGWNSVQPPYSSDLLDQIHFALDVEASAEVAAFAPDEIVLLPLYPQYSTTTSGSSLKVWADAYRGSGRVRTVCCYPEQAGLVQTHAAAIEQAWRAAGAPGPVRVLFSAHGLPEKIVAAGDPYQVQIEASARAVAARLPAGLEDWRVTYQSRVGPLKWLGPDTESEIRAASAAGLALVVCPIAFVSEHIETLVELDHEYGDIARAGGCPAYIRTPALGVAGAFIDGLAELVEAALPRDGVESGCGGRWCPPEWSKCPARAA